MTVGNKRAVLALLMTLELTEDEATGGVLKRLQIEQLAPVVRRDAALNQRAGTADGAVVKALRAVTLALSRVLKGDVCL